MKKIIASLFFLGLISCNNSGPSNDEKSSNKEQAFYPTAAFISEQLAKVDTLPLAIFKYTVNGDQTDSLIIPKEEFRKAAEEFLGPDITVEPLKKLYSENLLHDETTNMVTISYTTQDEDVEIRKSEVYINPANDKVKGIYIEKYRNKGDSSITKKLYWKTDRNFQVMSLIQKNNQPPNTVQVKYVWDPRN